MGYRQVIRDNSRATVGLLAETWQSRLLTSSPAAETRTWGAWGDVQVHASNDRSQQTYNALAGDYRRQSSQRVRISDATAKLREGDQLKDPAGLIWNVAGIGSSGPGTVAYDLTLDTPLLQEAERGGGA
jgi:hypothetical protein